MKKTIGLMLCGIVAFGIASLHSCTRNETASTQKFSSASKTPGGVRAPSGDWLPSENILKLNQIVLSVNSYKDIDPKVDEILAFAETKKDDRAVQVYAAAVRPLKSTAGGAQGARPFRGILWKMGGFVVKSEQLYAALVSTLRSLKYQYHLYSKPIDALFDYLALPEKGMQRFWEMSDFQNYSHQVLIPAIEASRDKVREILEHPKADDLSFLYDRSLAVGPVDFASEKDQYSLFIKPYVTASLVYIENGLGMLRLLNAYNILGLADMANEIMYDSFKETHLTLKSFFTFNDRKERKLTLKNVRINTPEEYRGYLQKYAKSGLFRLRNMNQDKHDGQKDREAALAHFQSAAKTDVRFIHEIQKAAQLANQDDYILNHEELLHQPAYKLDRVEKIARLFEGLEEFTDPLTGKSYKINVPRLFDAGLKPNLTYYYPTETLKHDGNEGRRTVDGEMTFWYDYGRPSKWNDPTFNGFLPEATNANFYEIHRALTFNNDTDILGNFILFFFM